MSSLRRTLAGAAIAALALATPAAPAAADGLPLPVEDSPNGALSPDGASRYLTVSLAGRTAILQQRAKTGALMSRLDVPGRFGIPLVAYDSTAGGVSHDGRTLVLIRPRNGFPRRETTLALLSTRNFLHLRRTIHLPGDFSYDALSADGRSLFLINYVSPTDPRKYRVRVFDLAHDRLVAKPVVDPRESPDEMNGFPITRVTSPDGRWDYTLYDRATVGERPFIHALDTRDRTARCIDLDGPAFANTNTYELKLAIAAGGGRIDVSRKSTPVASVDTSTFRVGGAVASVAASAASHEPSGPDIGWPLLGLALLGGGLAAPALARRRRHRHGAPAAVGSRDAKARVRGARGIADPGAPGVGGETG